MNKRQFFVFISALALATSALAQSPTIASKATHLVIQVSDNDPAKWNLALSNAKNVQEDLGAQNVEIEIVAYGPGIGMLKLDSVANSRVIESAKVGIKFLACENTMHAQKLTKDDMNPESGFVKAGVVEIMKKQAAGWAYLRP